MPPATSTPLLLHGRQRRQHRERGFTLIEMIMVIVLMGIIGSMVAVFMKRPIDAYVDTARRAALTDTADTAARRMARDIRKALPNSIRNPSNQCLEFIPTKTGGRYRTADAVAGDGTQLDFSQADTSFNMLGRNSDLPASQQLATGDVVAVYNLGITGADAYAGDNTSAITGVTDGTETVVTIASKTFPFASPGNRFQVIPANEKIVAFVCSGGQLLRSANHAYGNSCPTSGATVSVLATNVQSCNFVYNGTDLQRNGLVQLSVTFAKDGEAASLYHEVHMDNTP
jgi:MSHA biogenesis protein MshO